MRNKKHCSSSSMELLHHDLVERIMERLPAESLLRFKCVSKKWKSTMESRYFQKRQLIHGGDDPQVLLVHRSRDDDVYDDVVYDYVYDDDDDETVDDGDDAVYDVDDENVDDVVVSAPNIQVVLKEEAQISAVKIPTSEECSFVSQTSCDGLVCVYNLYKSGLVANPTTRWSRTFPPSKFQELIHELQDKYFELSYPFPLLGFGKDVIRDTYKLVFLYNSSSALGLEVCNAATICEVFDFTTDSWRYLVPASPHRVLAHIEPLYFEGSLHWFTEETYKLLSFNLHSETFQLISNEAPPFIGRVHDDDLAMCCLSNRLCVSQQKKQQLGQQLIWSFDSGNNKKTWVKLYSIDLNTTSSWFPWHMLALCALALPATTCNKLLLYDCELEEGLVLHDLETKSYKCILTASSIGVPLCYYKSLISIS